MRVLVGCGAAAGLAAIFNAPIAGVLFALEVVLGEFNLDGPETVASILNDLSTSGLIKKTRRGLNWRYHAVNDDEREVALSRDRTGALPALVWLGDRFEPRPEGYR